MPSVFGVMGKSMRGFGRANEEGSHFDMPAASGVARYAVCEDRVLDEPASRGKGSQG
jgi:hypothetical protein